MRHSFYLYRLIVRNALNKIRLDWARELTVGLAAAVLAALFFYVFNDFINGKLADVGGPWKERMGWSFTAAVTALVALFAAKSLRSLATNEDSPLAAARRLGEDAAARRQAFGAAAASVAVLGVACCAALGRRFAPTWPPALVALAFLAFAAVALALGVKLGHGAPRPADASSLLDNARATSRHGLMLTWRAKQMLIRNRATRFALALAALAVIAVGLGAALRAPYFALVLMAMAAGFWVAVPMAWQMRDDLDISWAERLWGVSHEDVIHVYSRLAWGLAAAVAAFALAAGGLGMLLGCGGMCGPSAVVPWPYGAVELITLGLVAAAYPCLLPSLLFQIDARRPAIPLLTLFLLGLFLGTAIFAHWASALLVPIVARYANDAQKGRYYRA